MSLALKAQKRSADFKYADAKSRGGGGADADTHAIGVGVHRGQETHGGIGDLSLFNVQWSLCHLWKNSSGL
jgi:hypothetical protein